MSVFNIYTTEEVVSKAKALFEEERSKTRLDGWFRIREIHMKYDAEYADLPLVERRAALLRKCVEEMPLNISEHAVFAGTQSDCFARSYALINPTFDVKTFGGYCDPTGVYNDIEQNDEFTEERIEKVRVFDEASEYTRSLKEVYSEHEQYTKEVAYFFEQVTGHIIPDFRCALENGIEQLIEKANKKVHKADENQKSVLKAIVSSLNSAVILAERYAILAINLAKNAKSKEKERLQIIADSLRHVPKKGARNLYEAIQSFIILWQVMCMEQAPNPFAFSVGNADRIFEPFREVEGLNREKSSALLRHFLTFFNVGDRSWAISQNILLSGRDVEGNDLTNLSTYAILDAFFDMNMPQPILSLKLHKKTPTELYKEIGRFLFTPGCLTPSFFNDDAIFQVLESSGIDEKHLPDYAIAGCQEPLIMGKDNGNTTNSWLNLGKILELTLGGGYSLLTGEQIDLRAGPTNPDEILRNIRKLFYNNLEFYADNMAKAANAASQALSLLPVPFLSAFMGGIESGIDMRDANAQGTVYNASGCLIHGLSVIADSFIAIDSFLKDYPNDAKRLVDAMRTNFKDDDALHKYLRSCDKFGNNIKVVDEEAAEVVRKVSRIVKNLKNYLGNPFRADWSSPSTHLLYGYWVSATPDGRKAREMLNYGVDPLHGDASSGLGYRVLSSFRLPYEEMNGGYASHFGIDPKFFGNSSNEECGIQFSHNVINQLFFNSLNQNNKISPYYLYVNITTPETLRKVLDNPKKYAPSGVYIMRIHGTFVNFLNLSPAIQDDIIMRLDLASTRG